MNACRAGIVFAVAGILASGLTLAGPDLEKAPGTLRVGTFDSRAVALAYGRSESFLESVRELTARAEKAEKDGNRRLLEELESTGSAKQEELHEQVFGGAPIDEILESIRGELPEVARSANVDVIVQRLLYHGPGVEVVDISREMAEPFHPDAQTRKIMEELLKTPPVDMKSRGH